MNVEINGETKIVPICTCGKCIIRRNRDGNNSKYPYNRNMGTTYRNSFQNKGKGLSAPFLNRSVRNNFDGKFREYLTSGLLSTMKFDFKPYLVKMNNNDLGEKDKDDTPFFGRSTYDRNFPSWGKASSGNLPKEKLPFIQVPFRGETIYNNDYKKQIPEKNNPCLKQTSSLGFNGKILNDTNGRESYKPLQPFTMEKQRKTDIEKTTNFPADYPKEFDSTYGVSYLNFDKNCELAQYLKKSGMKNLEI